MTALKFCVDIAENFPPTVQSLAARGENAWSPRILSKIYCDISCARKMRKGQISRSRLVRGQSEVKTLTLGVKKGQNGPKFTAI